MKLAALAAAGVVAYSTVVLFSIASMGGGAQASVPTVAVGDIPAQYLAAYQAAGRAYGIDWTILAGIGKVETDHGRSGAPGVRSGVNFYGCCAGPMQFDVRGGPPSTWDLYGKGDVYDPLDAIPAAARYLRASGAPGDYHRAILTYNHSEAYYRSVMDQANRYRAARPVVLDVVGGLSDLLGNPNIRLTPGQRSDFLSGGIDSRLVSTLSWIGQHHVVIVTALRRDHHPGTNHEAGRAVDIGSVDGQVCRETWGASPSGSNCSNLVRELVQVPPPLRSTELIYCWDPDGPTDPRGFARPDHCNHVHVGWDG